MYEEKSHVSLRLCLFAIALLLLTCVGMTMLIDGWAKRHDLEQKVSEQRRRIADSEQVVRSLKAKLAGAEFQARADQDQIDVMETQKHVLLASLSNLRNAERVAAAELESVEKEFGAYQAKVRKLIWSRSVGYRFGSLTIGYDRTYRGVRITEISEHGVKIVHDGGTSFISSDSMPPMLQKKFQLVLASCRETTSAPPDTANP